MKIKELEIKNIYGNFSKKIKFNDDKNFFIGINGGGKTTILRIINEIFQRNLLFFQTLKFEKIIIKYEFDNKNYKYSLIKNEDSLKQEENILFKKELIVLKDIAQDNFSVKTNDDQENSIPLEESISNQFVFEEYDFKDLDDFKVLDLGLNKESSEEKILNFFKNQHKTINLNDEITKIISPIINIENRLKEIGRKYLEETRRINLEVMQNNILKKLNNIINKPELDIIEKEIEKELKQQQPKRITKYIEIINRFFIETNKSINMDTKTGEFNISFNSNNLNIDSFKFLSSGEISLLVLITSIAFSDLEKFIIIMDEPETSLHLSWQKKIIKSILELTKEKEVQIILATHSPEITNIGTDDDFNCFYPMSNEGEKDEE